MKKGFSDEIVEFSKRIDVIFEKIARDIHGIKETNNIKIYSDKLSTLEKKNKKDIEAATSEINTTKRLIKEFISKTNKKLTVLDRKIEENKRNFDYLNLTIKKIESKLKIKTDEL